MPKVRYFQIRTASKTVTGADCVDLIAKSTVTHENTAAPGAPPAWTALPHPPHAHAHVSRDGFQRALVPAQEQDRKSLAGSATLGPVGQARLDRHKAVLAQDVEGRHIDPAHRGTFHPAHQIVDPGGGRYIDRPVHSQFEDSEAAVMALVYALNTPAGQDALAWLTGPGRRAVLTSATAANGLTAGPEPYVDPPATFSAHAQRGRTTRVVERGAGGAGAAARPRLAIAAVTLVLDYAPDGELRLVTHYPVSAWAAANDRVEQKVMGMGYVPPVITVHAPLAAPAAPVWSAAKMKHNILESPSKGEVCSSCAAVHGRVPSTVFHRWHRCGKCGLRYCFACGAALPSAGTFTRGRRCNAAGCDGTTALID